MSAPEVSAARPVVDYFGGRYMDVTLEGRKIGYVFRSRSGQWYYERHAMNFGPFATIDAAAERLAEVSR